MAFDHDVFISYSSADREWAKRLNDSLTAPGTGINTFFDSESLRLGDDWAEKIEGALESTKHLIVLWTDKAKTSDWVSLEFTSFHLHAKPRLDPNRRLIFINVQGANQAFKPFQQGASEALQAAYLAGQPAPQGAWDDLIVDVLAGLDPNNRPLPIPVVVLTMTHDELVALDAKRRNWITSDFRLSSARLLGQYGPTRDEWKPFASPEPISTVLAHARTELNKVLKGRRAEWQAPDMSFWEDKTAAKEYVDEKFNPSELRLLVIDPVAISHPDVFERLMLFQDSFTSPGTVIATLPPFGLPRRIAGLKRALQARGTPYFDDYFQPKVPPRRHLMAQCALHVSDADDIRRHLLAAAGQPVPRSDATNRPAYLQQGSSG